MGKDKKEIKKDNSANRLYLEIPKDYWSATEEEQLQFCDQIVEELFKQVSEGKEER